MAESEKKAANKTLLAGFAGFAIGSATVLMMVWLYGAGDVPPASAPKPAPVEVKPAEPPAAPPPLPEEATTPPPGTPAPVPPASLPEDLGRRHLVVPVQGIQPGELLNTFDDSRSAGRVHEAIDIMAPRNTPVVAVEGGRIAKLFTSDLGGLTIYQFDPTETYSYYYAHLERYASGIQEGARVSPGQVIGYVGSSGNAAEDNPHLHFAIFKLNEQKNWWEGAPINPFHVFKEERGGGGERLGR
ncbi:MAG TPA: M23 family metallopeptidase [Thermoanaerobaculia bacterium]